MMKRLIVGLIVVVATVGFGLGWPGPAAANEKCPADSVRSGTGCIDTFEASVWQTTDPSLIKKIRRGIVTEAQLMAGRATQLGLAAGDLVAAGCPVTGNGCVDFYAVSIPGLTPSRFISWFQAAAAARNAHKRLPSSAEWQAAALGTPDPGVTPGAGDCNTNNIVVPDPGPDLTGARANCVSDVGAFDMVGNVWEWVADWVPLFPPCGWGTFSDDLNCLGNTSAAGALIRGGAYRGFGAGAGAGVFAVSGNSPSFGGGTTFSNIGFRAARSHDQAKK